MQEDDAIALTLLGVGGRHKKPHVHPYDHQNRGRGRKPGNQLAGNRVKHFWR